MGKLIECQGKLAKTPYCFQGTGIRVYSIEEVCYYISSNIYMVKNEFFDTRFVRWLRSELGMEKLADKIEPLLQDRNNFKEIIATICCSCDYFEDQEIRQIMDTIDKTRYLSDCEKKFIEAGTFFRKGQWEQARQGYKEILAMTGFEKETAEKKGNVYHDFGVADALCGEFEDAAVHFRKAYELSQAEESKQQGLYAVLMTGQKDRWEQVVQQYHLSEQEQDQIQEAFLETKKQCMNEKAYHRIVKMGELLKEGRTEECHERMEECFREWKEEYRKQLLGEI